MRLFEAKKSQHILSKCTLIVMPWTKIIKFNLRNLYEITHIQLNIINNSFEAANIVDENNFVCFTVKLEQFSYQNFRFGLVSVMFSE